MGAALLRVLQRDATDGQAVLPQVRAGDSDADELQHRQLGQDAAAPQAQLPVQQARQRVQHPQAGSRHGQRQDGRRAGRRQGPLGQGPDPCRGPARVPAPRRPGPQTAPERPHGRRLPAEPGHRGEDWWAWADQGWCGQKCQRKEETLSWGGDWADRRRLFELVLQHQVLVSLRRTTLRKFLFAIDMIPKRRMMYGSCRDPRYFSRQ